MSSVRDLHERSVNHLVKLVQRALKAYDIAVMNAVYPPGVSGYFLDPQRCLKNEYLRQSQQNYYVCRKFIQ